METFEEFKQQNTPERSTGAILSHAFETYKGIFLYALLAMVIYMVASMLVQRISGFDSMLFSEELQTSGGDFSDINIWAMPGFATYTGLSSLIGILMAPLYVGVLYLANKNNNNEKIQTSDLFIGFRQNTLNIIIYGVISSIIIGISFAMCVLPGLFVFPLLMLGYPFLLFENASFSEALTKSFNIAKANYGVFLGTALLGALISISGVVLCGIGLLATMPFYLVVMYSAYCAFVGKPRALYQG